MSISAMAFTTLDLQDIQYWRMQHRVVIHTPRLQGSFLSQCSSDMALYFILVPLLLFRAPLWTNGHQKTKQIQCSPEQLDWLRKHLLAWGASEASRLVMDNEDVKDQLSSPSIEMMLSAGLFSWSSSSDYCGVPSNGPKFGGWPTSPLCEDEKTKDLRKDCLESRDSLQCDVGFEGDSTAFSFGFLANAWHL